jgi:hypothetical protein
MMLILSLLSFCCLLPEEFGLGDQRLLRRGRRAQIGAGHAASCNTAAYLIEQ